MYDDVNGEGKMLIKGACWQKGVLILFHMIFLYNFSVKENIDELSSTFSL